MIHEDLKSAESVTSQCEIIWNHYLKRKLNNDFEPSWTHQPYQVIKDFLDGKTHDSFILKEVIKSHKQKDATEVPIKTGLPKEGTRLMHDSWKAGSFTWIFMGRIFCKDIFQHNDYVIINRRLPDEIYSLLDTEMAPQVLYSAYKKEENFFVGPAISLEQLISHLDNN